MQKKKIAALIVVTLLLSLVFMACSDDASLEDIDSEIVNLNVRIDGVDEDDEAVELEVDGEMVTVDQGFEVEYLEEDATEIELKVVETKDYEFDGWLYSGGGEYFSENEEIELTMDEDKNIVAEFSKDETRAVTGVSIDQEDKSIYKGGTVELTANIEPENATNQEVSWSSNNEAIATVDEQGLVTALSEGTTTIIVTTDEGDYTAEVEITVKQAKEYTVTFDEQNNVNAEISVYEDEEREDQVGNSISIENGKVTKELLEGQYYFTASQEDYVDYESNFEVAGEDEIVNFEMVEPEEIEIEVTLPDWSDISDVELVLFDGDELLDDVDEKADELKIDGRKVTLSEYEVAVDKEIKFIVKLQKDGDSREIFKDIKVDGEEIEEEIYFELADSPLEIIPEFVIEDDDTDKYKQGEAVTGVSVDQDDKSIKENETVELSVTLKPEDATNQEVSWSSNNEAIATVNEEGLVEAVSKGEAEIEVTTDDGDYTDSITITVELDIYEDSDWNYVEIVGEDEIGEDDYIYYSNPNDWDEVNAYYWNDDEEGTGWPGDTMTEISEDYNDLEEVIEGWYYVKIPQDYDNVIFNNDDEQTDDLDIDRDNPWFDGGFWRSGPVAELTDGYELTMDDNISMYPRVNEKGLKDESADNVKLAYRKDGQGSWKITKQQAEEDSRDGWNEYVFEYSFADLDLDPGEYEITILLETAEGLKQIIDGEEAKSLNLTIAE